MMTAILAMGQDTDTTEFSDRYELISVNVNTSASEISPFLHKGKLYFSRSTSSAGLLSVSADNAGEGLYDIFGCERNDSIRFSNERSISVLNSVYNDGPLCFSTDDSVLYFSSTGRKFSYLTGQRESAELKLYVSYKRGGTWSTPEQMQIGASGFSYCHPAISRDGRTLYFASNQPGGKGGMDLYSTSLEDGRWSAPRNLSSINTDADEIFPFVSDSLLFFASDQAGGTGLDLYVTPLEGQHAAHALESPLNSKYDDFGFFLSADGAGYLTSNRNGNDDIFYFRKILPELDSQSISRSRFCYTFYEEATTQNLDTAGLTYEWDIAAEKVRGQSAKHCFPGPGTYPVKLNIIDVSSGEVFSNEISYDFEVEWPTQLYIDCADTARAGELLICDASRSGLIGRTIVEYYWLFGDGSFNIARRAGHKYLNTGVQQIRLGVLAINDGTGRKETWYLDKIIFVTPAAAAVPAHRLPDETENEGGQRSPEINRKNE
jgi:hypothetical protein